jgi:H+/gluconate symporter-like permease
MQVAIIFVALALLMIAAYRGVSVILFAPVAALLAVVFTDPGAVLPVYSGVFMERMAGFVKLYLPVLLLGAVFGKLMESSGFAYSIISSVLRFVGPKHAISSVVLVCALLTYGGVSLFVVAFAVYPFASQLFRSSNIPKRLLPATIALGAFTFTMDALPGSPQIQNVIPTSFFHTDTWAAPTLGIAGAIFLCGSGLLYLEWRRRVAERNKEGYEDKSSNGPEPEFPAKRPHPSVAMIPLLLVAALNFWLTAAFRTHYSSQYSFLAAGVSGVSSLDPSPFRALWPIECALSIAIAFVLPWCLASGAQLLRSALNAGVGGATLAALNVGSEYGFGAVIASLPGFQIVSHHLTSFAGNPLVNVAITSNILAAITGSASGGLSLALGAMGDLYLRQASASGIPRQVLHRVAAMASGGMDTLPHNGAIITLLSIVGLSHRVAYRDIFALTMLKITAAFFVIALYEVLGIP